MSMSNVVTQSLFFCPVEVVPRSSPATAFTVSMVMQFTGQAAEHWSQPMQSSMLT